MADCTKRTLIQKSASSIVKSLVEKVAGIDQLEHALTKGELVELFFARNLLRQFMPSQLGLGTGIVINAAGVQSRQMDIVVYDKRVLPPFIRAQNIGVYPVESVVATVEVASDLNPHKVLESELAARQLRSAVWGPAAKRLVGKARVPEDLVKRPPLVVLIGLRGDMATTLGDCANGRRWLGQSHELNEEVAKKWQIKKVKVKDLFAICVVGKFCWARTKTTRGWGFQAGCAQTGEETKRFVALLLDNSIKNAELRFQLIAPKQTDLLSRYLREKTRVEGHNVVLERMDNGESG